MTRDDYRPTHRGAIQFAIVARARTRSIAHTTAERIVNDEMTTHLTAIQRLKQLRAIVRDTDDRVEYVMLGGLSIKESDFAVLSELSDLPELSIDCEEMSDEWIAYLKGLHRLHYLGIRDANITGEGLRYLTTTELNYLDLRGSRITDDGLKQIARFSRLIFLKLAETHITDAGLVHLHGLQALQTLVLRGTKITDAGLCNLGPLHNLSVLDLIDTGVTDAGLQHLRGVPKLRLVSTQHTKVTLEGAEAFRRETGINVSRTSM